MVTEKSTHLPTVSIIVPVYNVKKYISVCAKSLLEQTYRNIEYIFVNDASTDNSLSELEAVVNKYPNRNIRIINNTKNLGSSASRNIGIDNCNGEFISFCDSDDWVEPDMIESMVMAINNNADVVVSPFLTNTFEKEQILDYQSSDIANLNSIPLDFKHFSLCNKLIRTHLIKENKSINGIDCWEDLSVISRIYATEPKVALLNKPFYHYRKYEYHSLTSASHEKQLEDRLKYADFLTLWFHEKGLEDKFSQFLNHLQFTAKIKMLRTSPRQFRRWKHTYSSSNKHIMSYTDIPLHYRIMFYIADKVIL